MSAPMHSVWCNWRGGGRCHCGLTTGLDAVRADLDELLAALKECVDALDDAGIEGDALNRYLALIARHEVGK